MNRRTVHRDLNVKRLEGMRRIVGEQRLRFGVDWQPRQDGAAEVVRRRRRLAVAALIVAAPGAAGPLRQAIEVDGHHVRIGVGHLLERDHVRIERRDHVELHVVVVDLRDEVVPHVDVPVEHA